MTLSPFPYTTLFRSSTMTGKRLAALVTLRDKARRVLQSQNEGWPDSARGDARRELNWAYDRFVSAYGPINKTTFRDRKSTRLNSSHMSSPYAVFCLIKKSIPYQRSHSTARNHRRPSVHAAGRTRRTPDQCRLARRRTDRGRDVLVGVHAQRGWHLLL